MKSNDVTPCECVCVGFRVKEEHVIDTKHHPWNNIRYAAKYSNSKAIVGQYATKTIDGQVPFHTHRHREANECMEKYCDMFLILIAHKLNRLCCQYVFVNSYNTSHRDIK